MSLRDEIANVIKNWYGYKDIDLCAADILSLPTMQSLIKDAERWRKVVEITPKRCVPDHEICGYSNCAGLCMRIRDIITGEGEG